MIPDRRLVQTTAYGGHLEASAKGEVLDVTDRVFPGIKGGGSHDGSVGSEESFRIWSSSSDEESSYMMSTLSIADRSMPEEGSPNEQRTMNESWQHRLPCSPDAHATGKHVSQVAHLAQTSAVGSELAVARGKLNQKDVIIRSLRRQLDEVGPRNTMVLVFSLIIGVPDAHPGPSVASCDERSPSRKPQTC